MAPNEEMLEELYELLALYFEISLRGGLARGFEKPKLVEPALDHILLREKLLTKITTLIMEGFHVIRKEENYE